jgi:PPM family protein phosphatase
MLRTDAKHLIQAAGTHPGMTGKINEDRYGITTCQVSSSNTTPVTFAVVCDGIGGHRSGEIAAELAVNMITNTVVNSFGDRPLKTMLLAAQLANEAIYSQAQSEEDNRGMGATCAMAWVEGSRLFTTSIGDTRIYLIRKHLIKQLTTDHTWVQEALENGTITKDQAVGHPNAHVIRRYLGAPVVPQADQRLQLRHGEDGSQALANQGISLRPDDIVLICTDGLSDYLKPTEIVHFIQKQPGKLDNAINEMILLACDRGGHDNITVVALQLPDGNRNNLVNRLFRFLRRG